MACKRSGVQIPSAPPPTDTPSQQVVSFPDEVAARQVLASLERISRQFPVTSLCVSNFVALLERLGSGFSGLVGDLKNDAEAPLNGGEDPGEHLRGGLTVDP